MGCFFDSEFHFIHPYFLPMPGGILPMPAGRVAPRTHHPFRPAHPRIQAGGSVPHQTSRLIPRLGLPFIHGDPGAVFSAFLQGSGQVFVHLASVLTSWVPGAAWEQESSDEQKQTRTCPHDAGTRMTDISRLLEGQHLYPLTQRSCTTDIRH